MEWEWEVKPLESEVLWTGPENRYREEELKRFAREVRLRPEQELERDIVELDFEISFLEAQVLCSIGDYTVEALEQANEKISLLKSKLEIMKLEYKRKITAPSKKMKNDAEAKNEEKQ
jgi:uncharacterized protein (UPF0218 family)